MSTNAVDSGQRGAAACCNPATQRAKPFLTAAWRDLALFTYEVKLELLRPHVTAPLVLDLLDGRAYASLVAFRFLNARVWGVGWPGWRNFVELNLRCYVRCGERRGVLFIREYVQPRLVAWVARAVYNEPYARCRMRCASEARGAGRKVAYRLWVRGREQRLGIEAGGPPELAPGDSLEHFLKEHRFGFGHDRRGRATMYEVVHPPWQTYLPKRWEVAIDWSALYGSAWSCMQAATPFHVMLAQGSAVEVYPLRPCEI